MCLDLVANRPGEAKIIDEDDELIFAHVVSSMQLFLLFTPSNDR